jgi:hypothetical protein
MRISALSSGAKPYQTDLCGPVAHCRVSNAAQGKAVARQRLCSQLSTAAQN